ncbi:hypothetical protein [Schnuerera sp. xch1]|nr:hypothetical protein [Schnuerera sp. xch1]
MDIEDAKGIYKILDNVNIYISNGGIIGQLKPLEVDVILAKKI